MKSSNALRQWCCSATHIVFALLFMAATACEEKAKPKKSSAMPTKLSLACCQCHLIPPVDALASGQWEAKIAEMKSMPASLGSRVLTNSDISLATAYYSSRAPKEFELNDQSDSLSEKGNFTCKDVFVPKAFADGLPAVSHIELNQAHASQKQSIYFSDSRSSALFRVTGLKQAERIQGNLKLLSYFESLPANSLPNEKFLLVLSGSQYASKEQLGFLSLGEFSPASSKVSAISSACANPRFVSSADLDLDGDLDFVLSVHGQYGPGSLLLICQEHSDSGNAITYRQLELDPRDGFIKTEICDLNSDGLPDIVALLAQQHEKVVAYISKGNFSFEKHELHQASHPGWGYSDMEVCDLDGNGSLDILLANGDSKQDHYLKPYQGIAYLKNNGDLKFEEIEIAKLYGCADVEVGDIDGDGDLDIAASSFLPNIGLEARQEFGLDSVLWFENEGQNWLRHAIEKVSCVHPSLVLYDQNQDGKLDVVVGNFESEHPAGASQSAKTQSPSANAHAASLTLYIQN